MGIFLARFILTGITSHKAFQLKCFIFGGIFNPQGRIEEPPWIENSFRVSRATFDADLTEKPPFESKFHISLSGINIFY